ncbi:hypothetical protein D9757_010948 [Collybiopsis confluens]|uniref:G domain-containing protein n=1 Tax=Collybiopsis confluens TaxID=2823264 RepID=A0A8H5LQW1_9AGAR|nr:hypothetical protein D9757_010948 [Collybiopsis confluens]
MPPQNILFFGPAGCGKSSIVNMLLELGHQGKNGKAPVSDGAKSSTKDIGQHITKFGDKEYNLIDTIGLDQRGSGDDQVKNLYNLLRGLSNGISLLVYCVRAPFFPQKLEKNYHFIHNGLCARSVKTVIVVTGREDLPDLNSWWTSQKDALEENGMHFVGHTCITATPGRKTTEGYNKQLEYDESKESLRELVVGECQKVTTPWKMVRSAAFLQDESRQALKAPQNIIFFGSTGCGKSSIVNMLLGEEKAHISNGAKPCTHKNEAYLANDGGKQYRLYDTIGLDQVGVENRTDILVQLYHLIRSLHDHDGVTLLVYCMRGPTFPETLDRSYRIFYEGFCRQEVPIVIVVTGLEDLADMESWWTNNAAAFSEKNLAFEGHACITAKTGKAEYNPSRRDLWKMISDECDKVSEPWKMDSAGNWFEAVVKWIRHNLPSWMDEHFDPRQADLYSVLAECLPEKEAREIAIRGDQYSEGNDPS